MNTKAKELMDAILRLEEELLEELKDQEEKFQYKLEGTKVKFEEAAARAHKKVKRNIIPFFRKSTLRNTVSAPFIYSMIIPLAFMDLTMSIYQHICFRLYGIPRVRRGKYIVLDRQYLAYLNGIEKLNCMYCAYGNGVIAYSGEVISLTEQYWCPIKHARSVAGTHKRYQQFLSYGDGEDYHTQVLKFRNQLKENEKDGED
ncbi:MAG: hypothetical protein HOF74_12515 [Gammaproteobacteria bacterium]|nr:hypothetical protein [Gammaproteobacteria bacterium]MBT3860650.1 hypothetical protein [Gammaproteobacteria bacterium]MBT3988787.1 hypothetical protein [Gammaproteobacteria bacterium]MBT4254902.1 hypothetical protein [Gammaproteobacteria bacterium]MBT4582650.1 hypothetical protein [Gammaproteobacteria bacterium]